ncbi:RNA polymerase sigma factor [Yinghuangia seranimata]|uniref:RNA polymerase sigma factor n=1 Tax=Yinghuangia seranimata TaxID=408067 RepID=UPI00248CB788|nr:RNA polymerase sigma factor [Yinghuangia seranimata]MDI2132817.1 RNA polymerase sigma factor [Yinghuangia seranimata]
MELSLRDQVRAGDPAAFARLFDAHAGAVHRYALRLLGDWAAAEDVVSLTFLEAWRLRGRLLAAPPGPPDPTDGLRPWVFGIATNVLRNTARSARRHRAALDRLPPRGDVPDFADEVVDGVVTAGQLAAARRALARLRQADREVLALVVWEGLGYEEAATALGVRVGTVKSRLSRARARLRTLAEIELREHQQKPTNLELPPLIGQSADDRHSAVRPKEGTRGWA